MIPMWSEEAEHGVIGSLLADNECADKLGTLIAADFYAARHRSIYAAIQALLADGLAADVVTVAQKLGDAGALADAGGFEYLNKLLFSVPSGHMAGRYAAIITEKAATRALVAAADKAKTIAEGEGESAEKVDQITSLFGAIYRKQAPNVPRLLSSLALARTAHYEALERGETIAGWRAHIPALTSRLSGGFRPGGLYILAARPGVGKSSFSQDLGLSLSADGLPTLFLSQEMNDAELIDRGIANLASVNYGKLITGKLDEQDWMRTAEAVDSLALRPFYVDDQPALTLRDIRNKAKQIKGLKVLIIDYLQLTASNLHTENRNSQIEEISRGLKALAKEMQIAVLALSQLNRDVDKRASKRPGLSDLRDSGAIEQDADVVVFLWPVREYEYEGRKVIGCDIAKNRQGRTGEFGLDFYGELQQWRESADDIKQTNGKGNDL